VQRFFTFNECWPCAFLQAQVGNTAEKKTGHRTAKELQLDLRKCVDEKKATAERQLL
jgi:hypothetical protein